MLEKIVTYSRLLIEYIEPHPRTWPKLPKSNKKKKKKKKRKKERKRKQTRTENSKGEQEL